MADDAAHERQAGRPRDTAINDRVLSVTRELLLEVGWDELSVRMVAAQAGVGRASVSRRWASKAELVLHAVLGELPDLSPFEGTDMAGWIDWVVRGSYELFDRPDVRAAVPGLLVALADNEDLRRALWTGFSSPAIELYTAHVEPATDGERRLVGQEAQALLIMAAGAALFSTTIAGQDGSGELRSTMTRLLTAAIGTSRPD
ncbi:MAG: TetR/AcrR family transcriptional regulator [Tomitella sp.]|nr:TetR/AcrR family transcriptional regulator [Tomitella sp.]